jgi:Cytochrome c554 and c-prime
MRTRAVAGLALLALLGGSLWWLAQRSSAAADGGGNGAPVAAEANALVLGGPSTCLPCHAAVVAEWQESMHSHSFTDPQVRTPDQSDNFQKQECLPCHASRSVFEHGIEKDSRVLARVERRVDGIDCLSCHGLPEGVAASRSGLVAGCRPALRTDLTTQSMCAACHNQHNTHDEWRASPAAAAGKDCLDCHMPTVLRSGTEAGAPRGGRSHRFLGGRDRDFALAGLTVTAQKAADGKSLHVELLNKFAGHNLPTDSRNRALDLVVTLLDARGVALPVAPGGAKREPGCETGTARLRYRNPYRASGDPSTQLPAGQTSVLDVPLGDGAASASVELFYKLNPWLPDKQAFWTQRQDVALR